MVWTSNCFARRLGRKNARSAPGCLRGARARAAAKEGKRIPGEISPGEISLRAPGIRDFGVWLRLHEHRRVTALSRRFARPRLPLTRAEAWPASAEACLRFHQETVSLALPVQTCRRVCPPRRCTNLSR